MRLISLLGVGNVGRAFVEHSLSNNLRQLRYCVVDGSLKGQGHSIVAHRIRASDKDLEYRKDVLRAKLNQAVSGSEICILVVALGEGRAGEIASLAAEAASEAGCITMVIGFHPFEFSGKRARNKAVNAYRNLRRHCDYFFPFPLERLKALHNGNAPFTEAIEALFRNYDRLVQQVLLTSGGWSFNKRVARGLSCMFATTRLIEIEQNDFYSSVSSESLVNDTLLLREFLAQAERVEVTVYSKNEPTLIQVDEVVVEIADTCGPLTDLSIKTLTVPSADNTYAEILSFGKLPNGFMKAICTRADVPVNTQSAHVTAPRFSADIQQLSDQYQTSAIKTEPDVGSLVSSRAGISLAKAAGENSVSVSSPDSGKPAEAAHLNPWKNAALIDQLARAVIVDSSRLPGTPVAVPELDSSVSWATSADSVVGERSSGSTTDSQPAPKSNDIGSLPELETVFAPGSLLAELDNLASKVELWFRAWLGDLYLIPGIMREQGVAVCAKKMVSGVIACVAGAFGVLRRARWRPSLFSLALLATPVFASELLLATLASISHTVAARNLDDRWQVLDDFKGLDKARIEEAGASASLTDTPFGELGLASGSFQARAVHLDQLAVESNFFNLPALDGNEPPFDYVDADDSRMRSRLANLMKQLEGSSDSTAVTLLALGFNADTPEKLSSLSGMSLVDAAKDLDALFRESQDYNAEIDDLVAGCGTALRTLRQRLDAKRVAPDIVTIPERHYILYQALTSSGSCANRTSLYHSVLEQMEAFTDVGIHRSTAVTLDQNAAPKAVYIVTMPRSLHEQLAQLERKVPQTHLDFYAKGMRAFYLLEFDQARQSFEKLGSAQDPVIASIGSYLAARASYWNARFLSGLYRPDQFKPWRHFSSDTSAIDGPDRELSVIPPRCAFSQGDSEAICVRAVYTLPAGSDVEAYADASTIAKARKALIQMPAISPELLEAYAKPEQWSDNAKAGEIR